MDRQLSPVDQAAYDELSAYTLTHRDPAFIHQHVVDAFAAQHANAESKPIGIVFALIGLYLCVERAFTGRQVQREHARLARVRRSWPRLEPPADRGRLTIHDVLAAPPGSERDRAISDWCASVWEAWRGSHERIIALYRDPDQLTEPIAPSDGRARLRDHGRAR
jgi:Family of unknown function (DUF5946)